MVPTKVGALHPELRVRLANGDASFCFMDGHHVGSALRDTWNTRPGDAVISYEVINDTPVFNNTRAGTRATAAIINSFLSYISSTKITR